MKESAVTLLVLATLLVCLPLAEAPRAASLQPPPEANDTPELRSLASEAAGVPITDEGQVHGYLKRLFRAFPGPVMNSDVGGLLGPEIEGPVLTAIQVVGLPATPFLIERLNDPDPHNRELAVLVIGRIGDDSAVPALLKALTDSASGVRGRAAWALGSLRATEALDAAARLRRDTDPQVRLAVAWALGNLRVRGALPPLTDLLRDRDRYVKACAAESLGALGCIEAVPKLIPLLDDAEDWVRFNAARALRTLTFGIVTVTHPPYDRKAGPSKPVHDLLAAYREFWRSHKRRTNNELMREGIDLRIARLKPDRTLEEYYEILAPLEQMTFQRFYQTGEGDPMSLVIQWSRWWAANRERAVWEWAAQTGWPAWQDDEDARWGLVIREGGVRALPLLAALGARDTTAPSPEARLLKHITLLDLGFGKQWATDADRQTAAKAWTRWYAAHRDSWDVGREIRRALPTAQGDDSWIAARTLRWLRDYSVVPWLIGKLDSPLYEDRKRAAEELQRLTGRRIASLLRTWESEVQRRNYAANWRMWWKKNAEVFCRREPPLPTPTVQAY